MATVIDFPDPTLRASTASFTTPSWYHNAIYLDESGFTWASYLGQTTSWSQFGDGSMSVETDGMTSNNYRVVDCIQACIDLRDYNMLEFTSAKLNMTSSGKSTSGDTHDFWTDDDANGIAVVTQLNDGLGRDLTSQNTDLEDIIQGAGSPGVIELVDRQAWSTIPARYVSLSWSFNSAGLAYINTLNQKASDRWPGYFFFSFVWGGMVDSTAPDNWATDKEHEFNVGRLQLELTYDETSQPIVINVGDDWKVVQSMQQNVSGSAWKEVTDLNINVGDVWKETK
jgi:hypothetical protein